MGNKASRQIESPPNQYFPTKPRKMQTMDEVWSEIDGPIKRQVSAILIGAGLRGQGYAYFAEDFPSRMKLVAVAEPIDNRREKMKDQYSLPDHLVVEDWKELSEMEKLADIAIICTHDSMHKEPAIAFANKGYALLLEKPMAIDESECEEITKVCLANDTIVSVGHMMRYLPICQKIREIIDSGVLGEVVTIDHYENINYWHFAHSYVRGNWRSQKEGTFSLMAKSCHDIDLIMYWMGDRKCTKIQSIGNLYHFKESQKPEGAADRCFDCKVEKQCPYSVQKVYLKSNTGFPHWPSSAVCDIEDHPKGYQAALTEALQTGPYGRCVYSCDNDVVDHQMVLMEFENGTSVSFTMNAFTRKMCRETRICGTKGLLTWNGHSGTGLFHHDFVEGERQIKIDKSSPPCRTNAHGGADFFFMNQFLKAVAENDRRHIVTGIEESLRSHKLVFAAERARINNSVEIIDF